MEGARVSKGTVGVVVVVSAASFIVNSRISQAHLGAGFLPVRCGKLGTRRRNGDERFCSDPGRAHWEGPDDGEEIESIRFPLSPPPGRPLCLLGGQVLAEDDDDDDNNEGGGGAGQGGGPAAAGAKARRRGRAGLCLRDKSFLGRWWRGGCGR